MKLKYFFIISITQVIFACSLSSKTPVLESSNTNLKLNNGVLFHDKLPFSGMLVSYHTNKNLKSEIQYIKGKKDGYEKQWYANGNTLIERNYKDGYKTGIHKSWWENGTQKFEYHFNTKGEFDGIVREWYKSGQIFRDFNYIDGKEVGKQRLYKNDGNIKANYEVVNGERFGLIGLKKCYTVTLDSDEVK